MTVRVGTISVYHKAFLRLAPHPLHAQKGKYSWSCRRDIQQNSICIPFRAWSNQSTSVDSRSLGHAIFPPSIGVPESLFFDNGQVGTSLENKSFVGGWRILAIFRRHLFLRNLYWYLIYVAVEVRGSYALCLHTLRPRFFMTSRSRRIH